MYVLWASVQTIIISAVARAALHVVVIMYYIMFSMVPQWFSFENT